MCTPNSGWGLPQEGLSPRCTVAYTQEAWGATPRQARGKGAAPFGDLGERPTSGGGAPTHPLGTTTTVFGPRIIVAGPQGN